MSTSPAMIFRISPPLVILRRTTKTSGQKNDSHAATRYGNFFPACPPGEASLHLPQGIIFCAGSAVRLFSSLWA
jgi:hypothetical protein